MNRFTYRVYYRYSGPTHSAPFRTRKSEDEIQEALSSFPGDLHHFLTDPDARVVPEEIDRTSASIIVVVITKDSQHDVDNAVQRCLNAFDLFGDKLTQTISTETAVRRSK